MRLWFFFSNRIYVQYILLAGVPDLFEKWMHMFKTKLSAFLTFTNSIIIHCVCLAPWILYVAQYHMKRSQLYFNLQCRTVIYKWMSITTFKPLPNKLKQCRLNLLLLGNSLYISHMSYICVTWNLLLHCPFRRLVAVLSLFTSMRKVNVSTDYDWFFHPLVTKVNTGPIFHKSNIFWIFWH